MREPCKTRSQNAKGTAPPGQSCISSLPMTTAGCFPERTQSLEMSYYRIVCLKINIPDLSLSWLVLWTVSFPLFTDFLKAGSVIRSVNGSPILQLQRGLCGVCTTAPINTQLLDVFTSHLLCSDCNSFCSGSKAKPPLRISSHYNPGHRFLIISDLRKINT